MAAKSLGHSGWGGHTVMIDFGIHGVKRTGDYTLDGETVANPPRQGDNKLFLSVEKWLKGKR